MSTNSHILEMPKGFIVVRILQILFALLVIALTGFLIGNTLGFTFGATAFGIFCGIITLIIVTYDIVSERAAQAAYNMWAILALDILMVIFWLSAMGSLAALRAAFTIPVTITDSTTYYRKRYLYTWAGNTYLAILAVSAAVAAIEMILFIVSLIMFGARLHRSRSSNTPVNGTAAEKIELGQTGDYQQPQQQPQQQYQQQPQQQYQQQPQQQYQQQPQQQYQQQPQQFQQAQQPAGASPTHNGFQPVSPVQQPVQPHHQGQHPQQYPTPTQSPAPQYPVTPAPHGYAEAPDYNGKA